MNALARMSRHDAIVKFFLDNISQDKDPKVVTVAENNKFSELKPDLEFTINGQRYIIDVSFVKHEN